LRSFTYFEKYCFGTWKTGDARLDHALMAALEGADVALNKGRLWKFSEFDPEPEWFEALKNAPLKIQKQAAMQSKTEASKESSRAKQSKKNSKKKKRSATLRKIVKACVITLRIAKQEILFLTLNFDK
jgi:hypothetical protein